MIGSTTDTDLGYPSLASVQHVLAADRGSGHAKIPRAPSRLTAPFHRRAYNL